MEMTIFEYLRALFTKEITEPVDEYKNSGFVIQRFLSSDPDGFFSAASLNFMIRHLPDWAQFYFLLYTLPKRINPPYLKFYKKKKIENKEILDCLCNYFNCSLSTAIGYFRILQEMKVDAKAYFGVK